MGEVAARRTIAMSCSRRRTRHRFAAPGHTVHGKLFCREPRLLVWNGGDDRPWPGRCRFSVSRTFASPVRFNPRDIIGRTPGFGNRTPPACLAQARSISPATMIRREKPGSSQTSVVCISANDCGHPKPEEERAEAWPCCPVKWAAVMHAGPSPDIQGDGRHGTSVTTGASLVNEPSLSCGWYPVRSGAETTRLDQGRFAC